MQGLGLSRPPVSVSFLDAAPQGVRRFMGQAPSSCSFWRIAATGERGHSAFVTGPADHQGCPIGAYTHRAEGLDEPALMQMLSFMAGLGYINMDEVPGIPRWASSPAAVVYARLGDAPVAADVVVVALRPGAAMLLGEAARAAGVAADLAPMARPTCMALPASAANGATLSLGCVGNRVYTGLDDDQVYMVVRGKDVEAILTALDKIVHANDELRAFHNARLATVQ